MKIVKNILIVIFTLFTLNGFAQSKYNHYYIIDGDTTFVYKIISYSTSEDGQLVHIKIQAKENAAESYITKNDLEGITTFRDDFGFVDKIPMNLNSQDLKKSKFIPRHNGTIKCWIDIPYKLSSGNYSTLRIIVQIEDKLIDVAMRKNYETYLYPILQNCNEINGKLSAFKMPLYITRKMNEEQTQLLELIQYYNLYCK